MVRLIDADALLDKLKLYVNGSVIGMIEQAPTIDAVPLDQCKECKNLLLPFKGRSTNPYVGHGGKYDIRSDGERRRR